MTPQERKVMELALEALELMYACYAHPKWISHKQQEEKILAQCVATTMTLRQALAKQEPVTESHNGEPVAHAVVAGVLYDFMGWLTSRRTRITLSDRDNAGPAVDAIVDFSKMRGLKLDDALVKSWQTVLATTPQQRTWVGLSDAEIAGFAKTMERGNFLLAIYDIEKKLKEKNT